MCVCVAVAFQYKAYSLFYLLMLGWELFVMVLLVFPYLLLTRRLPVPAALLRCLGGRRAAADAAVTPVPARR